MDPKRDYRSRIAIEGLDRTPHRAFLRACGLDDDDLDKPQVGIVSTQGENTPCSMSLAPQADAARLGVAAGGGRPVPFTTISVSDGVSMNHKGMRLSLVSREIIADSIEAVMRAHAYDALVGFAGCDKTLPGIMMAMVRLNCPERVRLRRRHAARPLARARCHRAHRLRGRGRGAGGRHERSRACRPWSGRARRRSAPAPASSPPTPWRWCRRRWDLRRRGRRCCLPSIPSASRSRGAPACARPRSWRTAARCRATSSPANHWRTRRPSWRRPAARPMRACICRRSRTRPACASPSTTSPRCSPARR